MPHRRKGENAVVTTRRGDSRREPTDTFVHGWCCDHTYFAPQFERYAERGHRVWPPTKRSPPDMSRLHEMFPDILYGKTVGLGQFPCRKLVPEQVNPMIDRFLALMLPRSACMGPISRNPLGRDAGVVVPDRADSVSVLRTWG